jgi:DNA-binding transcriptional MerR regulator
MSTTQAGGPPRAAAASLSIGEVAERTGLSVHTLRFYEREGILPGPVARGPNGHRAYGDDDLEWLEICTNLRASGMPLAGIRRYAELVREGSGNEQQRLDLLRGHRERVQAQIDALGRCLDLISWKVAAYEDRLAEGTAGTLWTGSR